VSAGYAARRLIQVPLTVAGIVLVGFLLIELTPGDPVLALAGDHGDEAYYAFMREKFQLDQPLGTRLLTFSSNALRGDLGVSYLQGRPVVDLIAERLPPTVLLAALSLLVSTIVGVGLGTYAASRAHRPPDLAVSVATLTFDAAPVFWLAQLALLFLALQLGIFPVQGMSSARGVEPGIPQLVDSLRHMILPVMVLASQEVAAVARITRIGLLEEMAQDYVRTARAKGLSERRVLLRHALRRALLPVTTIIGGRVGHLLSGAVIVEVVFGWPGIGRLLVQAIQTRDSPILLGIFLVVSASVVIANLITDLTYGWLDPRIRQH
jgi:peptide/nickel transport system permease protein